MKLVALSMKVCPRFFLYVLLSQMCNPDTSHLDQKLGYLQILSEVLVYV
jgi:hypothetical protein